MKTALIATLWYFSCIFSANSLSVIISTPLGNQLECDQPSDFLMANVSGGTAPYIYLWSTGSTSNSISFNSGGTYIVTVTDALFETATDTIIITQLPYFTGYLSYHAPTPGNCDGGLVWVKNFIALPISMYAPYNVIEVYSGFDIIYGQHVCNPGSTVSSFIYSSPSNCPEFFNGTTIDPAIYYAGPYSIMHQVDTFPQFPCYPNTKFVIHNSHKITPQQLPPGLSFPLLFSSAKLFDISGNLISEIDPWSLNEMLQFKDSAIVDFGINLSGTYIFEYVEGIAQLDTMGVILRDTFLLASTNCGTFTGTVFYDYNADCVFNVLTDYNLSNILLDIQPVNEIVLTNNSGNFSANLPYGTYTVTQINPYGLDQLCPSGGIINFTIDSATPNYFIEIADTASPQTACDIAVFLNSDLARPGFDYNISIIVKNMKFNVGDTTTLTLMLDPSLLFVSANFGGQFIGNVITWTLPSIISFEEINFTATLNIPPSTPIGSVLISNAFINQLACDSVSANNATTHHRIVTGAIDPNEKSVSPIGVGPQNIIPPNHRLQYTINFENVGNDTAFRVIVIDSLSANLDINTLQVEMASHDYFVQINSPNILRFTFENILLPDSGINNEASKGFITFSIDQLPTLSDGTLIENNAAIYFDYNVPVITNTVFNTIKNGPVAVCQNLTAYLDSTGNATVDPQQLNGGSYDFYGIANYYVSQSSFDCGETGINSVTFFAINIYGQTDSCIADITIIDAIPPQVFCHDTILSIDASCTVTISPPDLISSATDNCGPLLYSLSQSIFDCSNIGLNSVTLSATDASGNIGQCQATVTIVDVTGIENTLSPFQNAQLIPNPSSGKLHLPEITKGGSLVILDFTGRTVYSENNIKLLEKDFSTLPEGIYIFKFVTTKGDLRLKWVKID